jgi:hypothetical protein
MISPDDPAIDHRVGESEISYLLLSETSVCDVVTMTVSLISVQGFPLSACCIEI